MKMLLTVFGIIVALLALVLGGSYGVARAFRHFGISEDVAFFIGAGAILLTGIVILGAMLMMKGIVK